MFASKWCVRTRCVSTCLCLRWLWLSVSLPFLVSRLFFQLKRRKVSSTSCCSVKKAGGQRKIRGVANQSRLLSLWSLSKEWKVYNVNKILISGQGLFWCPCWNILIILLEIYFWLSQRLFLTHNWTRIICRSPGFLYAWKQIYINPIKNEDKKLNNALVILLQNFQFICSWSVMKLLY